jgi:ABC-2 type transport system permease protein
LASPDSLSRPSKWTIFRCAVHTGIADYRQQHTWFSWSFGWVSRCVCEVMFYATVGLLLGSREVLVFLLIGRGLFAGVAEVMWTIQSTAWERYSGTLPLLVSAPGALWPVFAGRSTQWFPSAIANSLIALLFVAPLFGVRFTPPQILVVLLATVFSVAATYCMALVAAAVVLRAPQLRNLASNAVHLTMGLFCGVLVPVTFWPTAVQWFAQIFPVSHGLASVRAALAVDGGWLETVNVATAGLATTALLGAAWFLIGTRTLEQFAASGRRSGAIDLDE